VDKYVVWLRAVDGRGWDMQEMTNDLAEALAAWEKCSEGDEAVLTMVMCENLDLFRRL